MKIPKEIKIGQHVYPIKWVKKIKKTGLTGQYTYWPHQITLVEGIDDYTLKRTFTHECFHALLWEHTHDSDTYKNEPLIEFLTEFILKNKLNILELLK